MENGVFAVGNVTEPVHCLTLSRGGRADSDFGQPGASQYKKSHKRDTYER